MGEGIVFFLGIAGLIAVVAVVGLTVESSRRRGLRAWVQEQRGTFEAGSLMSGAPVPEAAPFDVELVLTKEREDGPAVASLKPLGDAVTYRNLVRIPGAEASYAVAQYSRSHKDFHDEIHTISYVVCFVSLPGVALPQVDVGRPTGDREWLQEHGVEAPAPIQVAEAAPGFAKEFQVVPAFGTGAPDRVALARLLDRAVQAELLARSDLIAGIQVRGNVVRVEAVKKVGFPHREVLEVARRLAAAWAGPGRG